MQYIGLCAAGKDKNLAPIHAKTTYVCSKYRAKNEVELQQHIRDAVEACRKVHERGNIPIAPHLYWPRFLDDNDPQDRDYGIAAGLEALKRCDEMIVIIRQEGPEEEWISQGMQAEIAAAAKMGIEPQFIYIGKEKRQHHEHGRSRSRRLVDYEREYRSVVKRAQITGDHMIGLCPFHDDSKNSFSVDLKTGRRHCFSEDIGGN